MIGIMTAAVCFHPFQVGPWNSLGARCLLHVMCLVFWLQSCNGKLSYFVELLSVNFYDTIQKIFEFTWFSLIKVFNIKVCVNPSSWSWVDICRRMDRHYECLFVCLWMGLKPVFLLNLGKYSWLEQLSHIFLYCISLIWGLMSEYMNFAQGVPVCMAKYFVKKMKLYHEISALVTE
jgi:hypothetical protein